MGGSGVKRVEGVTLMVIKGDRTLGTEHTTQYTDGVLQNCVHLKLM